MTIQSIPFSRFVSSIMLFSNERSKDSDKFRLMAAKNPAMIKLRDTFDLVRSDMKELIN